MYYIPPTPCKCGLLPLAGYVQVMLNVVGTLHQMEEHLDGLQKAAIWDVTGISTKRSHRKGSLKGRNTGFHFSAIKVCKGGI